MLDVVTPVKVGGCEELRYALRSIAANLPHRRVWLIGHQPPWACDVEHLPTVQNSSKYRNTTAAMRAACEHPDISDPFIWTNDDIFVLQPLPTVPTLHNGTVAEVIARRTRQGTRMRAGQYTQGMLATARVLADHGHSDPLSYELHVPIVVAKAPMLAALNMGRGVPVWHKRTAYGAIADIGGEHARDCKVHGGNPGWDREGLFVSTSDEAWTRTGVGAFVQQRFPLPCDYETGQQPAPAPLGAVRRMRKRV